MLIFPAERNELLEIPQVMETQGTFMHMHEFSPTQYVSDIKHGACSMRLTTLPTARTFGCSA